MKHLLEQLTLRGCNNFFHVDVLNYVLMTLKVCDFSPQHGHGGVDLTHGVSVCLHRAVPAQLDYAVATLRH